MECEGERNRRQTYDIDTVFRQGCLQLTGSRASDTHVRRLEVFDVLTAKLAAPTGNCLDKQQRDKKQQAAEYGKRAQKEAGSEAGFPVGTIFHWSAFKWRDRAAQAAFDDIVAAEGKS